MRYTNNTYRWVYIIEGLFSAVCAILIWFGLPNDPANAYFLNNEEKWMMRVRNEQRRAYMGSDEFSWTEMRIALTDPKLMFSSVTQFCQDILLYGFSTFLPTILQSIGYDSFMSNVLTVPVYIWAAICFIAVAVLADRFSIFAWVCIHKFLLVTCADSVHSLLPGPMSLASLATFCCWPCRRRQSNTLLPFSAAWPLTPELD